MSKGLVPFPIRAVKPWVVVVQPGDSVSRIAHHLTGDGSKWVELVGANPQKELSSGNVAGSPYRVFSSLEVDEKLMVPASWPNPGHVGDNFLQLQNKGAGGGDTIENTAKKICIPKTCANVPGQCGKAWDGCKGTIDCVPCPDSSGQLDPYGALITTILGSYPGLPQPPAPYTMPNVSDVIASWYPYLKVLYPTAFPTTPAIPDLNGAAMWAKLVESAIAFLQSGQIPPTLIADIVKNIPWDQIPWDKIPWQKLFDQILKQVWGSDFWKMLINSTTVSPGAPSLAGSTGYKVDFIDKTIWAKAPFSEVSSFGWKNFSKGIVGPDPVTVWGNLSDPELLTCITTNPARAQQLVQYNTQCGFDKDMAKLKLYMCDLKQDPTKCTGSSAPPVPAIPGFPASFNWACSPSPQCIADQIKPLGIPDPCSPMPTCIPAWYKTVTGQGLPASEPKSDSNLPVYLGLGAAGIALVATVLVIAASD